MSRVGAGAFGSLATHTPGAVPAAVLSYGIVTDAIAPRLAALGRTIAGMGSVIVAAAARDVPGERAPAVAAVSPAGPPSEVEEAKAPGYPCVTLDPAGYRPRSLNAALGQRLSS